MKLDMVEKVVDGQIPATLHSVFSAGLKSGSCKGRHAIA